MYKRGTRKTDAGREEPKTFQGMLQSALEMEDEIAHSVYQDYMERKNWPADLKDEIFEEIRNYLTTLLEDTERHRKIIKQLQMKLGQNDE